jgi:hypothetical protein
MVSGQPCIHASGPAVSGCTSEAWLSCHVQNLQGELVPAPACMADITNWSQHTFPEPNSPSGSHSTQSSRDPHQQARIGAQLRKSQEALPWSWTLPEPGSSGHSVQNCVAREERTKNRSGGGGKGGEGAREGRGRGPQLGVSFCGLSFLH